MGKQTPKMSSRVVNAIRNLREAHGSTSKEIMNYIMSQCNVHESTVNRQMHAALKRGLDYGILKKANGHYFLNTDPDSQLTSNMMPTEQARRRGRRRRSRGRRRRGRRRGRRRSRRRGRRRRRSSRRRRRSTRRRGRGTRMRRMACTRCRCTKRTRDIVALNSNPVEQLTAEDNGMCTCEKESNMETRSRHSKSRDRSMSRSRSSANSDRDDGANNRRANIEED
ncbi:serine/Arginine-related protein 53-like [Apis cerana]|uniref:serine/Arginine-related protein 53-like n=1 Tax=Apis cerana TaxID=7461 RepID=UPI0007E2D0A8|nr:serine/Arginine-related protein 53-like [Apis cerana]